MPSKKFLNKTCVYCGGAKISSTRDHIFAESFFEGITKPAKIPQVPACKSCNHLKSNLEKYLTAVFPFGSMLSNSKEILINLVPKRLKKNQKLHKEILAGSVSKWKRNPRNGLFMPAVENIPFDNKSFEKWLIYIAQGLCFYHLEKIVPSNNVKIVMLQAVHKMCSVYDEIFRRFPLIEDNLVGVFYYKGLEIENIIIWEIIILGGLMFDDRKEVPDRIFFVVNKVE